MTAREVEQIILEMAPLEGAVQGDPNGLLFGDPQTPVTGIATTWTPTVRVLQEAAAEGLNLVLTHEIPFFPTAPTEWYRTLTEEERPHNLARRALLDRHGICICRCHSNWDCVVNTGIADSCARALGLGEPVYRARFVRMYAVEPQTLAQLAEHCKRRLGVPHVRVAGDLSRVVKKIGVAYGGFGQMWSCVDEFIIEGAEAVIVGECIDYTIRAAVDAGLGLIETSHIGSENPGMRRFAHLLQERLPDLPVRFIDAGHPWTVL